MSTEAVTEQPLSLTKSDPLLELIPKDQLTPEQKELLPIVYFASDEEVPVFRFLREPIYLDEFDFRTNQEMFLWRDNETMLFTGNSKETAQLPPRGNVDFTLLSLYHSLHCVVWGKTDAAIAETVTFFWSMQFQEDRSSIILSNDPKRQLPFDFATLTVEQLKEIMAAERKFVLQRGIWNAEQSIVLATRPHRIHLQLAGDFAFEDHGTAFVNAMEQRESHFGMLHFDLETDTPLWSSDNLPRLMKLATRIFTKLPLAERPPFETFDALEHHIETKDLDRDDFRALDLYSDSLCITMYLDETDHWEQLLIEFLTGVAEFGQLKRFQFSINYKKEDNEEEPQEIEKVAAVTKALIYAIQGNPNLVVLDLSQTHDRFDWTPHFPAIFQAIEKHKSLEFIAVKHYPLDNVYLSYLTHLLCANQKITVLDESRRVHMNHSCIDKNFMASHFS